MSTLLELARRGASLAAYDLSDMHGHLGRYNFGIPDLSPAGAVAAMDRIGIARTLFSHMRCMSADTAWGNGEVLKAMQEFPGRILGYFSVWPSSAAEVRRETERCLGQGFLGLKLHDANGFPYDDSAYEPAYALCAARRMPVLFHTWGDAREFQSVRVLSARYPDLAFLLAHAGSTNAEGYIAIARECPNVYLDTAFSASPLGLIERLVQGAGADKVVWGSDSYFFSPAQQLGKVVGADLPEADKLQILSGNAGRLLARVIRG